ncbi:CBS domain-containing protein [Streptomyces sp. Tu 3180]|uniref:CBS domain-containing protein n=1 Tax=Streptomyces sp. Tu 3180 TaxID=2682611 RepID=UPI00135BB0DE|nr:CBS domain-containing protein [Streptomyces sp. Tu 3180]KAF3465958.1 CBS domain-containing protein [Streptomyces sp. Tu 3180]
MTPVQMQHLGGDPSPEAVVDDREASGPRVCDDMTVEVALSLMAGARVDHLVLCDGDDRSTGLITLARLTALRDSPAYTDRLRLRDVLAGPFTAPGARPGAVGEHGRTPGVLPLAR